MTIIDMHGHIGTWHDFFIPESSSDWLVHTSARMGIAATGVSHLVALSYDTVAGNRMALDEADRAEGGLGVWLVANPHRQQDIGLIREQLRAKHVWGLKVHPDVHEHPITGPGYGPFLDLARNVGAPVLSHGQTRSPYSDPSQLAEVSKRYEGLILLIGHAGLWSDGFGRAADLVVAHPGLHLEICGSRLTSRWIERFVSLAGAEKVLFGTDACFHDPRVAFGKVAYAKISEKARGLVLGGNALRILGDRYQQG